MNKNSVFMVRRWINSDIEIDTEIKNAILEIIEDLIQSDREVTLLMKACYQVTSAKYKIYNERYNER